MALFKTLFSKQDCDTGAREKNYPCKLKPESISLETLNRLIPIRNLSQDELTAFTLGGTSDVFGAGSTLFKLGDPVESLYYLIEGRVSMQADGGKPFEISSDVAKARFPLSGGQHHGLTATAKTDVRVLRISSKIMGGNRTSGEDLGNDLSIIDTPNRLNNSRLFHTFCENFHNDDISLPTLPDLALKFRKATERDIGIAEAVQIIHLDPAIATKLVRVANSPLYLAATPVKSCFDAVTRLGLTATRNLVLSFCLDEIFNTKNQGLKAIFKKQWKKSVQISALCFVLASENKPAINPEEALLSGLLCNIGTLPLLQFAENFPEQYYEIEELEVAMPIVRGPVGSLILREWGFPEQLTRIPLIAEDWFHDSGDQLSLADIVILAKLHSYIGTPKMGELPAISSIPACGKLKDGTLSPEASLSVLHNAKDTIHKMLRIFEV